MLKKKGQVTVFIIIGIVIVASVASFFIFKSKNNSQANIPAQIQPVYDYVMGCMDQAGNYAIRKVSFAGGYNSFYTGVLNINSTVPYWSFKNKSYIPSEEFVNDELSKAFSESFSGCISNFESLNQFEINASTFSVNAAFSDKNVEFELKYPLNIMLGQEKFVLDNFNLIIASSFGNMYHCARAFIESAIGSSYGFCITCADKELASRGLFATTFVEEPSSELFVITSENPDLNNVTMQFNIAVGY